MKSIYDKDVLNFEWDEKKNRKNRIKHNVWFEEAMTAFDDPHLRVFFDVSHSSREDRFIALGFSNAQRLLVVVHCYRDADSLVRVISARKATGQERVSYEKRV